MLQALLPEFELRSLLWLWDKQHSVLDLTEILSSQLLLEIFTSIKIVLQAQVCSAGS